MIDKDTRKITDLFKAIITFLNRKNLYTFYVFSFFFLVFLSMYMTLGTVSSYDDHFFHFKFAEEMRDKGIFNSFKDFKAIYFSKMAQGNEYFVYYNFLYYLVIIPFTYIQPLFLGIKLYAIFAASLSFTILFWILNKIEVKRASLWTIAVFGAFAPNLIFRLFSSRPYTLAPAVLLLLLYFLHKRNHTGVFIISFLYIFWHSATFFLIPFIVLIYFIFEKFYGQKGDFKNILSGLLGSIASLGFVYLIAPGFLMYMYDTVFGIFKETILGNDVNIQEGNELYPVDFFDFIKSNYVVVCALIICISVFVYRYIMSKLGSADSEALESLPSIYVNRVFLGSTFFLTILFFLGTVVASARFEDYFVFFGALFITLYANEILIFVSIDSLTIKKPLVAGVMISIGYLFFSNALAIITKISVGTSVDTMRPVGEWLNQNVPKDDVVFLVDWSWFPQLYYHSSSHNYIMGLEPRFLYVYDQKLFWEWYNIRAKGYMCVQENCPELDMIQSSIRKNKTLLDKWYRENGERIADALLKDFHSSYIITAKNYTSLGATLDNSDRFEKKFTSLSDLYIYQVKPKNSL